MCTKEETPRITDDNGINVLFEKPKEGQICQTKIDGSPGYHSNSTYRNGFFETVREHSNRIEITLWKADYWLPAQAGIVIPSLSVEDPYPNVQASGKIKVDNLSDYMKIKGVLELKGYTCMISDYTPMNVAGVSWYGSDDRKAPMEYFYIKSEETFSTVNCNLHHLTDFGLSETKPFGPEDDGITVYDQAGHEWKFYSASPEHRVAQIKTTLGRHKNSRYISVETNPDGTTATALKFTRTKPEQ